MRPDQLGKINNSNNQNGNNYLHNKTNRYLNSVNNNGEQTGTNTMVNPVQKHFNFHKTLRKPPKGIYLNYEDLLNLAKTESNEAFEILNRRLNSLKKEVIHFLNRLDFVFKQQLLTIRL